MNSRIFEEEDPDAAMESIKEPSAFRKLEMERNAEEYFKKFDPTVMLSDEDKPVEKESKTKFLFAENSSTCVTLSKETPVKNVVEDYNHRILDSGFRRAPKMPSRVKKNLAVSQNDHSDLLALDCAEEPT